MAQQRVVTVDDITRIDFSPHRLPGCERGLLHEDDTRRGFCPSCGARRMAETAAHLVKILPRHTAPEQSAASAADR